MKKLQCEMCGGRDFMKQDGAFVCQTCGTKYSVEEARKMMVEVPDEAQSDVKVQSTGEVAQPQNAVQVESLLKLARSSFDSKNYAQAENFCNQVIAMNDKNFEAWKLKGEAINFQINAQNPRILEAYNCIMTAYRTLDAEGKEKCKDDILSSIKNCFEGEIAFWLDQMEAQRPTQSAVEKVKSTFNDAVSKVVGAMTEMGFNSIEEYQNELTNRFITQVNVKCVSTWNTTVGYNYYRDSLQTNNHLMRETDFIKWDDDDYRPNNEILSTYMAECDNLIDLLLFVTNLCNDNTDGDGIIATYENIIFFNSHVCKSKSYKRMVSTTTNGYGAITDRHEYWELDKYLTSAAQKSRKENNDAYKLEIAYLVPEYQKTLDNENRKKELVQQITALNTRINGIVTERKPIGGCLGYFFLIGGIITFLLCCIMSSMTEDAWTKMFFAVPSIAIGAACFKKTPSEEVVQANIVEKQQLINERKALQDELNSLSRVE